MEAIDTVDKFFMWPVFESFSFLKAFDRCVCYLWPALLGRYVVLILTQFGSECKKMINVNSSRWYFTERMLLKMAWKQDRGQKQLLKTSKASIFRQYIKHQVTISNQTSHVLQYFHHPNYISFLRNMFFNIQTCLQVYLVRKVWMYCL